MMEKLFKLSCILLAASAVVLVFGKETRNQLNYINPAAPSSKGNDFVLAFMGPHSSRSETTDTVSLVITTDETSPVSFTVEAPFLNIVRNESTVAGETKLITFQNGEKDRSQDIRVYSSTIDQRNKGIHIKAEGNKSILVFGLNNGSLSADAFLALPCPNNEYSQYAPDKYKYYVFSTDTKGTSEVYNSQFLIVPCEDNTIVSITASHALLVHHDISKSGTAFNIFENETRMIIIDRLKTALFESSDDLTGTLLESDKPITVIVGHECGQVPMERGTKCGTLIEQVPPDITYGQFFLTVPQPPSSLGVKYRVASVSKSANRINVTCTMEGQTVRQSQVHNHTLKEREYFEFDTGANGRDFCCIESEYPVTMMQYTKGSIDSLHQLETNPTMLYVPPVAQFLNHYTITTNLLQSSMSIHTSFISYAISSQFFSNTVDSTSHFLINGSSFTPDSGYSPIYCSDLSKVCAYGAFSPISTGEHRIQYDQNNSGFFLFVAEVDSNAGRRVSIGYPAGFELEAIGLPMIEIPDMTVSENVGMIQIPIERTAGDIGFPSVIIVSSRDNTATGNSDYIPIKPVETYSGHRLRFRRREINPRSDDVLNITIIDDDFGEPTETFEIFLVEVLRNAFVTKPIGIITILDDDAYGRCPVLSNEPFDLRFPNITLSFNETEIGEEASYECPCLQLTNLENDHGKRICGGTHAHGAEWGPVRIVKDCGLTSISLQLCQITHASANNPKILAEHLANITSNTSDLRSLDIRIVTGLLENLTAIAIIEENTEVRKNFLKIIDNLIRADSEEIVSSQTSTRLLAVINDFSDHMQMSNNTEHQSLMFVQRSYAIRIANIQPQDFNGETLMLQLGLTDDLLNQESELDSGLMSIFPGTDPLDQTPNGEQQVTAIARIPSTIFKDLGFSNHEVQRLSYLVFAHGNIFQSSDMNQTNLTLVSIIVSIRVNNTKESNHALVTPIEVTFQPSRLIENGTVNNTVCGHWDIGDLGSWLMDSCLVSSTPTATDYSQGLLGAQSKRSATQDEASVAGNRSNVVVHYSQPGHFGLLLDLTLGATRPPPKGFTFALEVITYVGLAASVVCLAFFLVTYLGTKKLRTNEHAQILINIAIALMCLYIIFVPAAFAAPVPAVCGIFAALLQYFMLVYFVWTAVEAFYLYMKLVQVLGTHVQRYVLKAGLVAWLAPLLIVAVSVGPGYRNYYVHDSSSGFCRAFGLPFWLGTILPFAILYMFNWIMFVLIVVSLCCRRTVHKDFNENSKEERLKFIKQQLTIAFGLATLFGLGWGFGLAASGTGVQGLTLAFQIIFSVFVGCQGLLLFILHGVKKQEARKQWKRWLFVIIRKPLTGSLATESRGNYESSLLHTRKTSVQKDTDSSDMIRQSSLLKEKMFKQKAKGDQQLEKQSSSTVLELDKIESDTESEKNADSAEHVK